MNAAKLGRAILSVHEGADLQLELDFQLCGANGVAAIRRAFESAYQRLFPDESLKIDLMRRRRKYGRDMMIICLSKNDGDPSSPA